MTFLDQHKTCLDIFALVVRYLGKTIKIVSLNYKKNLTYWGFKKSIIAKYCLHSACFSEIGTTPIPTPQFFTHGFLPL